MKTKNIFKTLAAAMLMPAMLLNTACNKDIDTENTACKVYTLPVTVNVTRQGDDLSTKATYNESTRKLEFSAGDKLFVEGCYHEGDYTFAGTLDYVSDGTFSGTITTQTEWTGTIEELLSDDGAYATLLPAGYGEYGYLSITEYDGYDAYLEENFDKAFASSKVTALEQFSCEFISSYSSGFALKPTNAILNFTITGLAASTEVDVEFSYIQSYDPVVTSGSVTTDASGTATFAIGIKCYTDLNACTLTVGGNAITIVSESKMTASGKIYNINRSAAPAAEGHALTASAVGEIVGTDGKAYAVADKDNLPTGVTAVAMIAYVSGSNGLAIALADEGSMDWASAKSTCEGKTAVGSYSWQLPSQDDWKAMFKANGGNESSHSGLNTALETAGGDSSKFQGDYYWSSTEVESGYAWRIVLYPWDEVDFYNTDMGASHRVRACLAF